MVMAIAAVPVQGVANGTV